MTSLKAQGGKGFGGLGGVRIVREALSWVPFFWAMLPLLGEGSY